MYLEQANPLKINGWLSLSYFIFTVQIVFQNENYTHSLHKNALNKRFMTVTKQKCKIWTDLYLQLKSLWPKYLILKFLLKYRLYNLGNCDKNEFLFKIWQKQD